MAELSYEKAVLRAGAIEAARQGLRGSRRRANRNPIHQANPAYDAALAIAGACLKITETVNERGVAFVLTGFVNDGMKDRTLAKLQAARAAIDQVLRAAALAEMARVDGGKL